MNTMLEDGYLAEIVFDEDANLLRGTVVNAQKPFKFWSDNIAGLRAAFKQAIREYRSGALAADLRVVREISAEDHQRMSRSASLNGRHRPGGAPNYKCLQQAYDDWLRELYLAFDSFREEKDFGRTGAELACEATVRFLAMRWENPELTAPFTALASSLKDVKDKQKPELFFDKSEPIRRPRSRYGRHLTRWPAALLEAVIRLKRNQGVDEQLDHSAARIARGVQNWACMASFEVTSTTVKNWRFDWGAKPASERVHFEAIVAGILAERDPQLVIEKFLKDGPPDAPGTPKF
jgi:predicted HicB family RNase H-like nuclease